MSTEDNKKLVRRHYQEVLTQKNLDVIDQIYAEQIRVGDTASMPRSMFQTYAGMTAQAFPDLVATVLDQVAEGDKVVSRWKATGTHQGQFMDIAATGKTVTITAIHIHQIEDGRIAALWEEIDMFGLRQQLGA